MSSTLGCVPFYSQRSGFPVCVGAGVPGQGRGQHPWLEHFIMLAALKVNA